MSLDDVPINGDRTRTWEEIIASALEGDGGTTTTTTTTTRDDDDADCLKSTPTRSYLKKGTRAMRTSPLTPKTAGTTPNVTNARSKVARARGMGAGGGAERGTGTTTAERRRGTTTTTSPSPKIAFGRREESRSPRRAGGGLFDHDVNVQPSTMEAWREHKARSARETKEFEALESRLWSETKAKEEAERRSFDDVRSGTVVRDFVSSSTAEEEEARAAFERAKASLASERQRFADERAAWEAKRDDAEEAFKAECEDVRRQFKREKAALMREAEAHLALPTKQERNEAKFLREQLERNEAEFKAEQQRAKLTVDRLRQQIVDLTNEISELRMEKRLLEEKCEVSNRLQAKALSTTPPRRVEPVVEIASPASSRPGMTISSEPSPSRRVYADDTTYFAPRALSVRDPLPSVSDKVRLRSTAGLEREIPHEDGRVERVFADGRRVVFFANGTIKEIDGHETTIFFTNGDIKRTHQNGIIEYYYFDVETWHTTHPTGVELYHFVQTNQVELHAAGDEPKDKEILFPDGTLRRVYSNGFEEDVAGL